MSPHRKTSRLWLALGGVLVALLTAAVFTLGSLNLPFQPQGRNQLVTLFALSTFIVAALLVFGLILTRSLLRLWAERRAEQLGSRFKTKMVLGGLAVSLLPVVFMFLFSYGLMNRTLSKWFPRPLEVATAESRALLGQLIGSEQRSLASIAEQARRDCEKNGSEPVYQAVADGAEGAWRLDGAGEVVLAKGLFWRPRAVGTKGKDLNLESISPRPVRALLGDAELWEASGTLYLATRLPLGRGALVVARPAPSDLLRQLSEIEAQTSAYEQQKTQLRAYKTWTLLALLLFTVLILFSTMWVALFLSKQVTVPIQALAEATREISQGNFAHRVPVQAQDELGILVGSFNQMAAQLGESRRQIDDFTRNLQQALEEIEHRRMLMETILENIPTGVLSVDANGTILRGNPAVAKIFGARARDVHVLAELVGEEAARDILQLMRKSLRMGAASRELEIGVGGRPLHAALTVSSLGPRRANPGYVVVIDDLTELLRAQKAAAWQEVAQRIAHEIKNPLTPIQLSAQRLLRHLERFTPQPKVAGTASELERLTGECAGLIEREVATLKSLVDEFSQFARFPAARLAVVDLNGIVASALEIFQGRLEGITVRTELSADRPRVKADAELLRRVLVNLIDNAAEAMEGCTVKELHVATRLDGDGDTVEIAVVDTGHGISPEDKDKLFLPQFSTRDRGTGLGLAIASRIIAEHHGTIRVEDNQPTGARFVIRLPVAEAPVGQVNSGD